MYEFTEDRLREVLHGYKDTIKDEDYVQRRKWYRKGELYKVIFLLQFNCASKGNAFNLTLHHGAVAVFFVYVFVMVVFVAPIVMMEIFLGEYSRLGPLRIWKLAPIARGLGLTMLLANFFKTMGSQLTGPLAMLYLNQAVFENYKWKDCSFEGAIPELCCKFNDTLEANATELCRSLVENREYEFPALHYYYSEILVYRMHKESVIKLRHREYYICSLLCWLVLCRLLYVGVHGIKTLFNIELILFGVTHFMLLCFIATSPGSELGLNSFFSLRGQSRLSTESFVQAFALVMGEMQICLGIILLHSSYMERPTTVDNDAVIIGCFNLSVLMITFLINSCAMGAVVTTLNIDLFTFPLQGDEIYFALLPQFLLQVPLNQLWSILLFTWMLIGYLLEKTICVDTVLHGLLDAFPKLRWYKLPCLVGIVVAGFPIGAIIQRTSLRQSYHNIHVFLAHANVMGVVILETMVVFWLYGVQRLSRDVQFFLGFRVNDFWKYCWYIIPAVYMIELRVYIDYVVMKEDTWNSPHMLTVLCASFSVITFAPTVAYAVHCLMTSVKRRNLRMAFQSEYDWGPKDARQMKRRKHYQPPEMLTHFNNPDQKCRHKCLLHNTRLQKRVRTENTVSKYYF